MGRQILINIIPSTRSENVGVSARKTQPAHSVIKVLLPKGLASEVAFLYLAVCHENATSPLNNFGPPQGLASNAALLRMI